jgi:chromosome segregation ATPase
VAGQKLAGRGPIRYAASIQLIFRAGLWKRTVLAARLSLPITAGILPLMSDVVSPFPTWLTYQQVAERLGLRSTSAAAARARRGKWPRRTKNDTLEVEVCVPADLLAAGPQKAQERRQPVGRAADATALLEAVEAAVAPLQALIKTLSEELKAARVANDALRDQLAAAQSEAAELRGRSAANEAALAREVVDRRALQQQADHIRRERQAAQERVAQVQANLREEQARLQVTEDLVTRLKRELNEVQRAKERRRWWQWR